MPQFAARFALGQKVYIDGDESITASVVQIAFRKLGEPSYLIAWIYNGSPQETYADENRLSEARVPIYDRGS